MNIDGRWVAGVVVYNEPGDHKAVSVDVGEMRYMMSKRRVRRLAVVR